MKITKSQVKQIINEEINQILSELEEERLFLEMLAEGEVIEEAEYRGRKVKLNKPMRGDVKKFKVYVRDPKTGKFTMEKQPVYHIIDEKEKKQAS